ncbi:MAG: hypothetical protein VX497_08265, partial [Candidatus Neomarinimicrobiota bacterium]|nr:hypothetical protein [Candidatus Neomarinimicrobiota bacterium]
MRNLLLTFLTALFLFQGCSSIKGLFGKKGIMDPNDPNFLENIQKLKNSYKGGNVQALNELVSMYQDENQQTKARVIAGKA